MPYFWVVINFMGQERWVSIEAETIEEAELKFKQLFPRYVIKDVQEEKIYALGEK